MELGLYRRSWCKSSGALKNHSVQIAKQCPYKGNNTSPGENGYVIIQQKKDWMQYNCWSP